MDKNSLIGLGIIAAILGVWLFFSGPSKQQIARNKQKQDSVLAVQQKIAEEEAKKIVANTKVVEDTLSSKTVLSDSAIASTQNDAYRDFSVSAKGAEEIITIENNLLKAYISTKGAQVLKVELKKYNRPGQTAPLVLFDKDSTNFSLRLSAYESKPLATDSFYFKTTEKNVVVQKSGKEDITFKLETSKPGSYIEFVYSLKDNDYMLGCDMRFVGMDKIITSNVDQMTLNWRMNLPSQEKYIEKEQKAATAYWKFTIDKPDYINPQKETDEEKALNDAPVKWVSFKQQFFNSILIAQTEFLKDGSFVKTSCRPTSPTIVKVLSTDLGIPYNHTPNEKFGMKFYFGPNDYKTLSGYGDDLQQIIPTGWSIFSYINKWMVIPLFDLLGNMNMGVVILILTLIVKIVLLPIGYKTYMSGARMRVLKPETEAITAKYKDGDPMKKQQETMALYRKAGVNPLSGCIPLLLQFPILIALFAFIPAAIELRQKGFLWADDLSTYDSIWTFGKVSIINSIYGDHVSLFAALMFVSTIIYTWMNSSMLQPQQGTQMPGMKFMMYFMPVIFLAVMNSYAAGLSWYYFLANMFTFSQNYAFKLIVDDKKIRAKIEQNMKKPVKVSNFQKKLADMTKQREQQLKAAKKK
ncbi:MAG TPA: membrane protein insertase YidC [Bacteroidia bacterium]|nr:membrane protein insertase YidC [Bacteroidia bacterium]